MYTVAIIYYELINCKRVCSNPIEKRMTSSRNSIQEL